MTCRLGRQRPALGDRKKQWVLARSCEQFALEHPAGRAGQCDHYPGPEAQRGRSALETRGDRLYDGATLRRVGGTMQPRAVAHWCAAREGAGVISL